MILPHRLEVSVGLGEGWNGEREGERERERERGRELGGKIVVDQTFFILIYLLLSFLLPLSLQSVLNASPVSPPVKFNFGKACSSTHTRTHIHTRTHTHTHTHTHARMINVVMQSV